MASIIMQQIKKSTYERPKAQNENDPEREERERM